MKMPAEFYMAIISQWSGTPNEKFDQWELTYNDVSPPPPGLIGSDEALCDILAAQCDHEW